MMKRTIVLTSLCLFALAASRSLEANDAYLVRNLVSDIPDLADHTDPNLLGAWGISESGSSPFWISDAGAGVSTLYSTNGTPVPLVVTIAPSKASGTGSPGIPTGTVFNASGTGFEIAAGKATPFLFATLDGTVQGWSPAVDAAHAKIMVDNSAAGAAYFGLAMATDPSNSNTYLYAANFHAGTVDVFDTNYNQVALPGDFKDRSIPSNYAPFNVQNLGGNIYVAFALQNGNQSFSVSGPGLGYVDVFAPNGVLMQQLVAKGQLNAPWGLAIAPAGFGDFAGDLLVGNFGDGTINAFNPTTGAFVAQLNDPIGAPITIPNLWALRPGNGGSGGEKAAIYFTAGIPGPDNGNHGLFGRLHAGPQIASNGVANGADPKGAIAPNTWITIMGPNLAETTRIWNPGDIVNGVLPVEIDGVRVTINGNPAPIYYVSPSQLNVLTSTGLATGSATVQVNNNGLVSTTAQFQVQALAPAFFFGSDGTHVMATHSDGSAVTTKSPAQPGETVWLYGTGFGPTNPATPDGMLILTSLPVVNTPTVMIGGAAAQVASADLTSAGVYQIAVIIPAGASSGDNPVVAQVGGVSSPVALIPVQ
jgi:uncharacterized protein (TIGR03118 family)